MTATTATTGRAPREIGALTGIVLEGQDREAMELLLLDTDRWWGANAGPGVYAGLVEKRLVTIVWGDGGYGPRLTDLGYRVAHDNGLL